MTLFYPFGYNYLQAGEIQMTLLKILKASILAIIDLSIITLGCTSLLTGSLLQTIGLPILALFPIVIIGILTSNVSSLLVWIPVILVILLFFIILLFLISLFTQISSMIGNVTQKISFFLFMLHDKIVSAYDKSISETVQSSKWLHIAFFLCYIAKGFYFISMFILKYLIVPAIGTSIAIVGYFIHSCKQNYNEPIAKFIIDKFSYFATPYEISNVICVGFLALSIIALLFFTTRTLFFCVSGIQYDTQKN